MKRQNKVEQIDYHPRKKKKKAFKPRFITDRRMFEIMDFCIANKIKGIETEKQWCKEIRYPYTNLNAVKTGRVSFQPDHQMNAMNLIRNGNFNFLFGVENNMFLRGARKSAMEVLKEGIRMLENGRS